jgi:hypothetical protein
MDSYYWQLHHLRWFGVVLTLLFGTADSTYQTLNSILGSPALILAWISLPLALAFESVIEARQRTIDQLVDWLERIRAEAQEVYEKGSDADLKRFVFELSK